MINFLENIAPYFFLFLSVLVIIEGGIYFLYPEKVKWMLAASSAPFVKALGGIIILFGILCYFMALLVANS